MNNNEKNMDIENIGILIITEDNTDDNTATYKYEIWKYSNSDIWDINRKYEYKFALYPQSYQPSGLSYIYKNYESILPFTLIPYQTVQLSIRYDGSSYFVI